MRLLEAAHVSVRYGEADALRDAGFTLDAGEWLMVTGPNGAGKSTLLNAVAQSLPSQGTITYRGREVRSMKPRERARYIGVLAQSYAVGYAFTVEEVVRLGRYAYAPHVFSRKSGDDGEYVAAALAMVGLDGMRDKPVTALSGGELQRVFLAQVLAQDPAILLLDEPSSHLDLKFQKELFELLQDWLKGEGRAVISVVHDIGLAKAYGTRALLLKNGRMLACGGTEEVLSRERLAEAFELDVYAWMRGLGRQWEE